MKIVLTLLCGIALGVVGLFFWLVWYFRDVYK